MTLHQIAYLSTRPDLLGETLEYVHHFMPWVNDVVVVTPRRTVAGFAGLGPGVTVIADEDLVEHGTDLAAMDHQSRNYLLRVQMCRTGAVDDVFLCSDDDYRPLKAITADRFLRPAAPDPALDLALDPAVDHAVDPAVAGGRDQLVGYTFYDLVDWAYDTSEFDRGQHNTLQLLAYLGAEQKSYASHMPQAIDRDLMVEAAAIAHRLAPRVPVDEWAIHFNLGRQLDPARFAPAQPYLTLGWPQYPNEWRREIIPSEYAFENFYPELYQPRHLYAGIPTALDPTRVESDAVEKLLRWRHLDMAVRRLEMPKDLIVPWTGTSRLRQAYFGALRPARKTVDYLLLGERAGGSTPPR